MQNQQAENDTEAKSEKRNLKVSKPVSLTKQIHMALSEAIISGELKPGEILVEQEMQKWFKVSRAPIRESIRLLEADGLVVVDAYKKKYVRRITENYVANIVQLSSCIEGFSAWLSIDQMTISDIGKLESINASMEESFAANNFKKCTKLNFAFHRLIMLKSENELLRKVSKFATKTIGFLLLTQVYYDQGVYIPRSISEHERIINAYHKGEGGLVEKEVRQHILNSLDTFKKYATFDKNGDLII